MTVKVGTIRGLGARLQANNLAMAACTFLFVDESFSLNREALPHGNGDLNALLRERNGTLCLRVATNDVTLHFHRDPDNHTTVTAE
ncbi:MAG: hypothetical protein KJ072_22250 [Verrucomicrobia bacterium]|nr:hypothetical protein [Verrucomicrobiota bacterium]